MISPMALRKHSVIIQDSHQLSLIDCRMAPCSLQLFSTRAFLFKVLPFPRDKLFDFNETFALFWHCFKSTDYLIVESPPTPRRSIFISIITPQLIRVLLSRCHVVDVIFHSTAVFVSARMRNLTTQYTRLEITTLEPCWSLKAFSS